MKIIHIKLTVMAFFWASAYPLGRHLAQYEVPGMVVVLRLFFATLFLAIIAHWRGELKHTIDRRTLGHFLLLGVFGFCVHNLLMMTALQYTRASTGAVLNGAIPLVIVLLDFVFFKRRIPPAGLFGIGLGFLGTAVVASDGAPLALLRGEIGRGEAMFLVAVTGWAIYSIASRPLFARLPTVAVTTYACGAGLFLLSPIVLFEGKAALPMLTNVGLMLFLAVQTFLSMSLGYLWYSDGVKEIGPMNAAMYGNLVPVFGIILAAVTLNERPDVPILIGTALIICSLLIVNQMQRKTFTPLPE